MFAFFRRSRLKRQRSVRVREYRNDLFPRSAPSPHRSVWSWGAAFVLLLAIFIGGGMFIARYRVTTVKIEGTTRILQEDILNATTTALDDRRFLLFREYHSLMLSKRRIAGRIAEELKKNTAVVESVKVEKRSQDTLLLTITERKPVAVFETNGTAFLLDADGTIVQRIDAEMLDKPPLTLVDQNDLPAAIGERVAPSEVVKNLTTVATKLQEFSIPLKQFQTQEVTCPSVAPSEPDPQALPKGVMKRETNGNGNNNAATVNANGTNAALRNQAILLANAPVEKAPAVVCDLHERRAQATGLIAETEKGWQILFETRTDIPTQLTRLETFLRDVLKDEQPKQYLDVRFDDYVYYR